MIEEVKTVYRYDAGGSGFRKVAGRLKVFEKMGGIWKVGVYVN